MVCSTRCSCGSVGPAATAVSVLPAPCSSLPINPSASCRSSRPPGPPSASRPTDVAGLGIVYGHFSNDLQDSQRRAQQLGSPVGIQRYEIALELTYRFRFYRDSFFFQPDLQYIIRPGGTGRIADAFVAGFQVGINF